MGGERYTDDPGWFVDTRLGRLLLSLLLGAFAYFVVVWNMPESHTRDELRPPIQEVVWAAGIAQNWGVFAPNPVSISYRVEADVELADGSVERYEFPDGEPFLGAYREFRWRKFESRIRRDEQRSRWRPTALWIRDQFDGQSPVSVTLIRRTRKVPEPGSGDVSPWEEEDIYTIHFAADEGTDRPAGDEAREPGP